MVVFHLTNIRYLNTTIKLDDKITSVLGKNKRSSNPSNKTSFVNGNFLGLFQIVPRGSNTSDQDNFLILFSSPDAK